MTHEGMIVVQALVSALVAMISTLIAVFWVLRNLPPKGQLCVSAVKLNEVMKRMRQWIEKYPEEATERDFVVMMWLQEKIEGTDPLPDRQDHA